MSRLCFVACFSLCACFRSVIIDEQRIDDIAEALEARVFEQDLQTVRDTLRARLPLVQSSASTPIDELLTVDDLAAPTWRFCFAPGTEDCVVATESPERHVTFRLHCAHAERCTEWVWETLAEDEVHAADKVARDRMEERATLFEQRFPGKWTPAAGIWASIRSSDNVAAFGVRAGARRWVDPYLMATAMLEYEHSFLSRNQLAAHVRFELSTWSKWTQRHWGLPETSGYVFLAPVADFGGEYLRGGMRAGAGVQVIRFVPLFLEIALQTLFPKNELRMVFRLGVGV